MSNKSSAVVVQLSFCNIVDIPDLRGLQCLTQILSYYKLNVHLQIHLVWPERLQAQHRVLKPPSPLSCTFHISSPSKRQTSSSDCCS